MLCCLSKNSLKELFIAQKLNIYTLCYNSNYVDSIVIDYVCERFGTDTNCSTIIFNESTLFNDRFVSVSTFSKYDKSTCFMDDKFFLKQSANFPRNKIDSEI